MAYATRSDIITALEDLTEHAADCAGRDDPPAPCVTAARAIIEDEKRLQRLMDAPPYYGAGCDACA